MNDLISQLFSDSNPDLELMEELSRLMEAAAKVEKLSINKSPLVQALKSLGIEGGDLTPTPGGFILNLADADDYHLVSRELGTLDSLNKLAEAGWIASFGGDSNFGADPAHFYVKFIELDEHPEEPSDDTKPVDLDKVMKDGAYWVPEP
jgi:hypothetical protein